MTVVSEITKAVEGNEHYGLPRRISFSLGVGLDGEVYGGGGCNNGAFAGTPAVPVSFDVCVKPAERKRSNSMCEDDSCDDVG